ncbi:dienelactone hydrolase family protein [Gordonia phosphorivorans]|uniref:Dienelactone hydrolase family protein n=1 Tax=Gordonia phosphorivorans TaxID=1056982 RepID=A0ABV6H7T1_9ACTN
MFGKKKVVAPPPDELMKLLARRGPHKVDRGDLGIVGLSGQVFAPREGKNLPAVAFGHGWLRSSRAYRDLLFHLASWGIVVAAPDSERGPLASDIELATDLRAALTVCAGVQLGAPGRLSVDADRLGLVGHGFGAAAAVRAAADRTLLGRPQIPVRALVTLFPAPTAADLRDDAAKVTAPALILAAPTELDSMTGNAVTLTELLGGEVVLRTLAGASAGDLLENPTVRGFLGVNGAERKVHAAVRAQVTGYLLHRLAGREEYAAFAEPETTMGAATVVAAPDIRRADADHLSQLLGNPAYRVDDEKRKKRLPALGR